MNFHINILERITLESLNKEPKNLKDLISCTSLNRALLNNILESLIAKGLINLDNEKYYINKNINEQTLKELKNPKDIKIELNDIINAIFDLSQNNKSQLKLKKFHLNEREEKVFNGLIYNLESFINSVESKREPISQQKVFIWGGAKYEDINTQYLNF